MPEALDWARDGPAWPHHEASRFVKLGALRWHLQRLAPRSGSSAPQVLLIHGTGASCHSWRLLAPLLAERFEVIAPDLPGHAFTITPSRQALSLPAMARALAALLGAEQVRPDLVIGHSAGAAIAAQLCLDGHVAPQALLAINGAMLPLHGVAGQVFSPLARLLAANPLVPRLFAWQASRPVVLASLLEGTGSRLDSEGARLYGRLVADPGHARGALRMMAAWDLRALALALPRLPLPLHLLAGERDRTLPHDHARRIQRSVPGATLRVLPGLGHLAHEEDARAVMAAIASALG
jgi:magnesium chelatase accessory protein